jgi:hypothetical protein
MRTHIGVAVAGYILLTGSVMAVVMSAAGSLWRSAFFCSSTAFLFFWAYQLHGLNARRDDANVPRFAREGSKQLHMLRLLRVEDAVVTPVGEHAAPAALRQVLILSVVAAAVTLWPANPASASYHRLTGAAGALLDRVGSKPTSAPESAATPPAASVSPIELCPDVESVRQTLTANVPQGTGRALFRAWYGTGRDAAGCPLGPATHAGQVVVVQLTGGEDSPAALYASGDRAAVVFSDFYALVAQRATELSFVEPRHRWGLGTLQLLHSADGSCSVLERYGNAAPVALPASVSSVVLSIADRTGAMPRLTAIWPADGQTQYAFDLIAPDPILGQRKVDDVLITYGAGISTFSRTGASAADGDLCPSASHRLAVVAAALEQAVQTAASAGPQKPAPAP